MNLLVGSALLVVLTLGAAEPPAPWFVADCRHEYRDAWDKSFENARDFESAVRSAAAGSPLYVPKPYPRTASEIVTDVRWWYERTWNDTNKGDLPEDERLVHAALRDGTARFEVLEVADWTPARCNAVRPRNFYFILRVRDRTNLEIARFAVNPTGLVMEYVSLPERPTGEVLLRWKSSLPALTEVEADLAPALGSRPSRVQYVRVFTPGNLCGSLSPCVALEGSGVVLVQSSFDPSTLLRFTRQSPRVALAEYQERRHRRNFGLEKTPANEPRVLSVADLYVIVDAVAAPKPE